MSSHPLITRALSPGAPVSLRLATARGRVPVPRSVLLSALIHLLSDPDGVVRDAAQQSISKLTETEIFEIPRAIRISKPRCGFPQTGT